MLSSSLNRSPFCSSWAIFSKSSRSVMGTWNGSGGRWGGPSGARIIAAISRRAAWTAGLIVKKQHVTRSPRRRWFCLEARRGKPQGSDGPSVNRPGCACVNRVGLGASPSIPTTTLWREGDLTMKQLLSVLLAATFAAVSVSAIAQDKKATEKKAAPAKSTEKKAAPAKSPIRRPLRPSRPIRRPPRRSRPTRRRRTRRLMDKK